MSSVLVTGAHGGVGSHICLKLELSGYVAMKHSRTKDDPYVYPSDIAKNEIKLKENVSAPDWIIHCATTRRIDYDRAMLLNILNFARQNKVRNFLYLSTWGVQFRNKSSTGPKFLERIRNAQYIEMKKQCEKELHDSGKSNDDFNIRILRPSVIIGGNLQWDRILQTNSLILSAFSHSISRCFVHIDEVVGHVMNFMEGREPLKTVTSLGMRIPIASVAACYRDKSKMDTLLQYVKSGVIEDEQRSIFNRTSYNPLTWIIRFFSFLFISFLASVNNFMAGFFDYTFFPEYL